MEKEINTKNQPMYSKIIEDHIVEVLCSGNLKEISSQTGINRTKLWRLRNRLAPLRFDEFIKLDKKGYLDIFKSCWQKK